LRAVVVPSAIVDSNLVRAAVAERLRQRTVHQAHLQPGATHDLRRRCVFGDLAAKRLDPAGALKLGAPPQHCFALSKTAPETVDHVLPTRLISVEEGAFDLSPKSARLNRRCHCPRLLINRHDRLVTPKTGNSGNFRVSVARRVAR